MLSEHKKQEEQLSDRRQFKKILEHQHRYSNYDERNVEKKRGMRENNRENLPTPLKEINVEEEQIFSFREIAWQSPKETSKKPNTNHSSPASKTNN